MESPFFTLPLFKKGLSYHKLSVLAAGIKVGGAPSIEAIIRGCREEQDNVVSSYLILRMGSQPTKPA